ncbi:hypothetical protein HFP72_03995 [Nocardiopsis sp. ARC36]
MAAHITAHGDAGPRADPAIPIDQRNSIDNLLYLCPSCHSRIDKNSGAGYTAEELLDAKGRHEAWTRSLRQAGSAWNVRYHHVDFVNITRLAMLPGADDVLQVTQDIGLDTSASFQSQGMLAGVFVKRVKPIFENWGERALDLDPAEPIDVKPGMVVSFDAPVRARNIRRARYLARISGSIKWDPHLRFAYGKRTVAIRFDPVWLTTTTSLTTLGTAEKEAVTYAGLGTVVAVTKEEIQVSAMVFGQPDNGVNTFVRSMSSMSPRGRSNIEFDRMVDSRSARGTRMSNGSGKRSTVDAVLYFDESLEQITGPEPMEKAVFGAVAKAVPEYRRDMCVGLAPLNVWALTKHDYTPTDVASHLVAAPEEQWSSFSIPRLGDLISQTEIAYVLLRGLEIQYLDDLDEILIEDFPPYRGGFQLLSGNRYHEGLHGCVDKFRVRGGDLRVLYSARDLYEEEGLDKSVIEYWTHTGLFSSVAWEEDEARSQADEEEARRLMGDFLSGF